MANLHSTFIQFEQAISVRGNRLETMRTSKTAVQTAKTNYFRSYAGFGTPNFYIQGSYKMGTLVLKKDNTYDVDLGVHFPNIPKLEPKSLQSNVRRAMADHTARGAQHREKCVRVIYAGEFNIDLPVYCAQSSGHHTILATKSGWEVSDPKALVDWFAAKKDPNGPLVRIVKYLTVWASQRILKMPSGIALSVWAANNFRGALRDDEAFLETVKAIRSSVFWFVSCQCPVIPRDNLTARLNTSQRSNFKDALDNLIEVLKEAISHREVEKARNICRSQFGRRFP